MPRISLSNLPVEIHIDILKHALYSSQYAIHVCPEDGETPEAIDNRHKLSQFPYNAAATCQLWHAILTEIPECWIRAVIDVADDPHKFLDIFVWSKDLRKLEVTIFNSAHTADLQDVDCRSIERERVSAIFAALRPHISRCKSITFDVAFLTSLPSPEAFLLEQAPHLEELCLECKIDNGGPPEEYSRTCDFGIYDSITKPLTFRELKRLSLSGFWFMFVGGRSYGSEWFKAIRRQPHQIELEISQFRFQEEGQYSLKKFVSYWSLLPFSMDLTLRDLSLDYDDPVIDSSVEDDKKVAITNCWLQFRNVSPDVLRSLSLLANICSIRLLYDNCTFLDENLPSRSVYLVLKNIPHFPSTNPHAQSTKSNMCNIVRRWTGPHLSVKSCPSFDDDVLAPSLATTRLRTIYLCNCTKFTINGLRRFLKRENELSQDLSASSGGGDNDLEVVVAGKSPVPSEEDKEWFYKNVYTWEKPHRLHSDKDLSMVPGQ